MVKQCYKSNKRKWKFYNIEKVEKQEKEKCEHLPLVVKPT